MHRPHSPGPSGARAATARAAAVLGVILTALSSGCGSADVRFVSLDTQEIDPPGVEVTRFKADRASWCLDETGRLVIAFRCKSPGLLGRSELIVSLAPGEPPAGSGRNYPLHRHEPRIALVGPFGFVQRLRPLRGVMTVTVDSDRRIRGSFRMYVRSDPRLQLLSLFPPRPGDFLCFGTFQAVRDARLALRLCDESEDLAGPRPPPATQPAR